MNTIENVFLKITEKHINDTGSLVVVDYENDLKKIIKRSFIVNCPEKTTRGKHAHKELNQFLICLQGICEVVCDDGNSQKTFTLDSPNKILKIPNQIWAEQYYKAKNTCLLVMCDDVYKENDYIRDYELFKNFRNNA